MHFKVGMFLVNKHTGNSYQIDGFEEAIKDGSRQVVVWCKESRSKSTFGEGFVADHFCFPLPLHPEQVKENSYKSQVPAQGWKNYRGAGNAYH